MSGRMFRRVPGTTRNRTRVSLFTVDCSNHYTTRRHKQPMSVQLDLLNDHAEHTCTTPGTPHVQRTCNAPDLHVCKDDLTGDCQLVSKMPGKAQKKTTRQDPKKRAAEDTRAASDDEVNRRCTHLQRASTACTRQRGNRTEIVRCKHVQLTTCATYDARNR
ncbi:hypothetical protein Bbelb_364260 [Branchiostoma belcheri]|nr:hypothetical protein Bbelb_364260 [Branchiostoma belcheri]